ncbi:glucose-1-phosphate thymidylyltransferase RfbA [Chengkuizengella axinellae]|uniref:Glucose-1-phosphate thymidylyltransferase n=1 Tax=Chengkuizengella axinellae TaxID=3064388 RepID=A0ABT9J3B4_9BACL|nr:glucose-1-phosphate thymidylyltransferase RfbA [Chengkuizengella sp. 2205SS18-9]MDP5275505.1 glucose-1-phosphate thymidylyltransferase RfbA [Chengkuizengella sp. 2205SS18-9]
MKGIILAGGSGSRLYPLTKVLSKQLLPIYDKPMIYYPLSILMLAGIREILIISTPQDTPRFKQLLKDGKDIGLTISYEVQTEPKGIAEAFKIGKKFIHNDRVSLILGDNIFHGHQFIQILDRVISQKKGATIFGYPVKDPERFGVIELNQNKQVVSIVEKPDQPKSNYAVTGLYFYDNRVVDIVEHLTPSSRGELEITDVNQAYLNLNDLHVELLGRGFTWIDSGTHNALQEASIFVSTIQKRQNLKIACIEEIAYRKGYITNEQLLKLTKSMKTNSYSKYLMDIVNN